MTMIARTPKQIGEAVRRSREALGLTQSELAAKAGSWQPTISKVEKGLPGTKLSTLFDVLAVLNLELAVQPRSKADIEDVF